MSDSSSSPRGAPKPVWKTGQFKSDKVFTVANLLDAAGTAGVLDDAERATAQQDLAADLQQEATAAAERIVASGHLTQFQIDVLVEKQDLALVYDGYVIINKLGSGGMATVYLARDRQNKHVFALKVVDEPDPRFDLEIRASARLAHPHVLQVFDRGEANGLEYLVMEYVDGPCVSDYVDDKGRLAVDEALELIGQAAKAVRHIHEHRIVHRDLKPHNMMLSSSGELKVLDFGLARFDRLPSSYSGGVTEEERLTVEGQIVGTPAYTAPEQIKDSRTAGYAADIYSLGCTLYYLLAGRPPYLHPNPMKIIQAQVGEPIPSLHDERDDVPPAVEALYTRMMAKQVADRYQTIEELIADLERLQRGEPLAAGAVVATEPHSPARKRGRRILRELALFTLVLSLAVGLGMFAWSRSDPESFASFMERFTSQGAAGVEFGSPE